MQWSKNADTVPVTNTFWKNKQIKKYSEPCSWRWTGPVQVWVGDKSYGSENGGNDLGLRG
jgi:hypothetical protein